jgi:hypothetical protein
MIMRIKTSKSKGHMARSDLDTISLRDLTKITLET